MPTAHLVKSTRVERSPRVRQLEGLFDLPAADQSVRTWDVELPIEPFDWHIGLVVGPSGSGKTTLARALFPEALGEPLAWPADRALVDAFPGNLSIKEITSLLNSVGFSSPPSWLRPYGCLPTGEQFRADMARRLAESPGLVVVDEFTSVVDRTVARTASAALAKGIRRRDTQFIAVTCHEDVIDWLAPDWVFRTDDMTFHRRSLRPRPAINLDIRPAQRGIWRLFGHHHYLSHALSRSARVFAAWWDGRPAAMTAVLYGPHADRPGWREHRTVCLPDYQGVGIGNAMSEFVASLFAATGLPYRSVTGHPSMIGHRARSPLWRMTRKPGLMKNRQRLPSLRRSAALHRLTASFEYVGPPRIEEARRFGIT
jgi:energy-coupling factor transporter ATP-binding protein EcfA2